MALLFKPKLLLFDESTTALDVLVEQEILSQITKLQQELGFPIVHQPRFVSCKQFVDSVVIMKDGVLIESCDTEQLIYAKHPYTQQLLTDQRIEGVVPAPSMPDVAHARVCLKLIKAFGVHPQRQWSRVHLPFDAVDPLRLSVGRDRVSLRLPR